MCEDTDGGLMLFQRLQSTSPSHHDNKYPGIFSMKFNLKVNYSLKRINSSINSFRCETIKETR